MAQKRTREGKKVPKNGVGKKSRKLLSREDFEILKDFNATNTLNALRSTTAYGIDTAMDRRRPAFGFPEKLIFDE